MSQSYCSAAGNIPTSLSTISTSKPDAEWILTGFILSVLLKLEPNFPIATGSLCSC